MNDCKRDKDGKATETMKHYYYKHNTAIFKRRDAKFLFSHHLANVIIQGLINNQGDFDYIDTDKIQKILNEYGRDPNWRVTKVGKKKIVFEKIGTNNLTPVYKTWIYWKDNRSYEVFVGSNCCDFYKY